MSELKIEKPADATATTADVTMESPVTSTDPKSSAVTDEEQMEKAMRQIEFYFADTNLPYDKFMWTLYTKDPEHWVPLSVVSSFKRMKEYASNGVEWIADAVRKSDFLEVSEDGTKVRRTTEPQEPKNQFERSIYAKGFGEEDATLQARLEEFFGRYGAIASVRMRRDDQKKFKGSVFVEFCDFDTVEKFLKADPKPSWNGDELLIMTKEDYCEMKIKEKGLTGKSANHRRELMTAKKFDAFREMSKAKSGGEKKDDVKKDVFLDFLGHKLLIKEDEDGNGTIDENDVPYVKGATLKFDGCGGDVTWSEIKDPIKTKFDGKAPYIKYARGENSGLVGFYKALSEEEIQYVKDTIKTINKNDVSWTLPSEEEEKQFEIERAQAAARTALQFGGKDSGRGRSGRGGPRGRGGRGGRGGGRGGRGRGGRGGGGDRNREARAKENDTNGDEATGEKRKRAVEPDGGPNVGIRGNAAPPTIQPIKRVKTNEGTSAPAS